MLGVSGNHPVQGTGQCERLWILQIGTQNLKTSCYCPTSQNMDRAGTHCAAFECALFLSAGDLGVTVL
jgi:hypothetical protein